MRNWEPMDVIVTILIVGALLALVAISRAEGRKNDFRDACINAGGVTFKQDAGNRLMCLAGYRVVEVKP